MTASLLIVLLAITIAFNISTPKRTVDKFLGSYGQSEIFDMLDCVDPAVENAFYAQLFFGESGVLLDDLLYILGAENTDDIKYFFDKNSNAFKTSKNSADVVIYSKEHKEEIVFGLILIKGEWLIRNVEIHSYEIVAV